MVAQQRSLNMRNELAQAQLRAGSLERELEACKARIEELEGQIAVELIGYVAAEDIQNKPDYFDVATKWNGHNKVPVYAIATPANSRSEAIGAAKDALEAIDGEFCITGQCKDLLDAALALLQQEGKK